MGRIHDPTLYGPPRAGIVPPVTRATVYEDLLAFMATGYLFKVAAAGVDTIPFYLGAPRLARYLRLPPPDAAPHPPAGAAVEAGVG